MCIIAVKPSGTKFWKNKTLHIMWANNPHGAGIMYPYKGKVVIRKGFMTYEEFKAGIDEVKDKIDTTATPVVLHFRIATHGGINKGNTHPFPVTDDVSLLKRTNVEFKGVCMAHNGIIPITPRKGISDTMEFIASRVSPIAKALPNFLTNEGVKHLFEDSVDGSRLCFLAPKGDLTLLGDWVEHKGYKYSNHSFEPDLWGMPTRHAKAYSNPKWDGFDSIGIYDDYDDNDVPPLWDDDDDRPEPGPKMLMPLDYLYNEYVEDYPRGTYMPNGVNWLLDEDGNVYHYDPDTDKCTLRESAVALDGNLDYVQFDVNRARSYCC